MCAADHRRIARQALVGNWGTAVAVCLVAVLMGASLSGTGISATLLRQYGWDDLHIHMRPITLSISILGLIFLLLGGPVRQGLCRYLLDLFQRDHPRFSTLFSQFDRYTDGLCLLLLQRLFIFLWSLLFLIPGIIAAYRYAMAPFIMAEDPECTASEAIRRSKEMMNGHKFDLFCLHLSFIGWALLCAFTFGIGYIFLNPYTNAADASFYRELRGYAQ